MIHCESGLKHPDEDAEEEVFAVLPAAAGAAGGVVGGGGVEDATVGDTIACEPFDCATGAPTTAIGLDTTGFGVTATGVIVCPELAGGLGVA